MLDISQKEKEVIDLIRNLSSESEERIHNILMAIMQYALLQYGSSEQITIPLFGDFYIKYKGDKIVNDKLEADLDCFFVPSATLKKNIGQYEDSVKKKISLTDIDIMKYHKLNIERIVKNKIK